MTKRITKHYFDILFSIVITIFAFLLIFGQIAFIIVGLTIGIYDWGVEGALGIGFGAFGPLILIIVPSALFGAWRYWDFDETGVTNGNLFFKRKLLFSEIESVETKMIPITGKPFIMTENTLCFHKGKITIIIPTFYLSKEEEEELKTKATKKDK